MDIESDKTTETQQAAPAPKPQSKAEFIRGLPLSMPAKEVVLKAKDAGLTLSDDYVHDVRGAMKKSNGHGKTTRPTAPKRTAKPKPAVHVATPKAPPRKKTAMPPVAGKTPTRGQITKAGFVRAQPLSASAKEIVEAASKLGLHMSPDYVHKVRSAAKAGATRPSPFKTTPIKPATKTPTTPSLKVAKAKAAPKAAPRPRPQAVTPTHRGAPEATFRRLALEIGLGRARSLVEDVERKIGALIAGR